MKQYIFFAVMFVCTFIAAFAFGMGWINNLVLILSLSVIALSIIAYFVYLALAGNDRDGDDIGSINIGSMSEDAPPVVWLSTDLDVDDLVKMNGKVIKAKINLKDKRK